MRTAIVLAAAGCAAAAPPAVRPDLASDMADAAQRFLSTLTPEQAQHARFALDDGERLNWHYIPRPRRGVALGELSTSQRHLAYAFLATALSRRGLLTATTIMALEDVLRDREHGQGAFPRDPGAYFLTIFGEPSLHATWGWRLEGHHLSLNLTLVDGVHPVAAPAFFGASPSTVDAGPLAGTRVLGREEALGFTLLASLDVDERRAAIRAATAPEDILIGPGGAAVAMPGVPALRMTPAQREVLVALLDACLANLPRELADSERQQIVAAGLDQVVFSWLGRTVPGEPHYFRLTGPTFVYELDNTQDHATHVHTVWHARGGDFGTNLLRDHYRADHGVVR